MRAGSNPRGLPGSIAGVCVGAGGGGGVQVCLGDEGGTGME